MLNNWILWACFESTFHVYNPFNKNHFEFSFCFRFWDCLKKHSPDNLLTNFWTKTLDFQIKSKKEKKVTIFREKKKMLQKTENLRGENESENENENAKNWEEDIFFFFSFLIFEISSILFFQMVCISLFLKTFLLATIFCCQKKVIHKQNHFDYESSFFFWQG